MNEENRKRKQDGQGRLGCYSGNSFKIRLDQRISKNILFPNRKIFFQRLNQPLQSLNEKPRVKATKEMYSIGSDKLRFVHLLILIFDLIFLVPWVG